VYALQSLGPNRDALRTRPGESRALLPQVLLIDAGCEWENYAADSAPRLRLYAQLSS
jgi:Xaa-Pro aminopeptidase